ncbi:glycosyl hydrolase family 95 catalytic domain-containing protein [Dyadobacter sp. CY343]|uniref:glycoside hydrolase family 95 protein n=1 Tax=Dyadobacter sp. CY343 TaxID=2907299 RepID=UPI001F284EBE|nr:glycoside hydrolase family 95 protein [Dyadobacter sp. CY343]MCE7060836.1 glycoside hydrolase family 95 protein [Dyadobacter sp. CY343]
MESYNQPALHSVGLICIYNQYNFIMKACLLLLSVLMVNSIFAQDLRLWYEKPAEVWTEALPVGNGHMGAMIFGGVEEEHLQLNEVTLYSGDPKGTFTSLDVRKDFRKVDSLFKIGKYKEAESLVAAEWLGRNHQDYQPLGDLKIKMEHSGKATGYRRSLDLATATTHTEYQVNGTTFKRDIFASYPNRVIVIRLTASGKEKLNGELQLSTLHTTLANISTKNNQYIMSAKAPGFVLRRSFKQVEKAGDMYKYPEVYAKDGSRLPGASQVLYGEDANGWGMGFEARIQTTNKGGKVEYAGDKVRISGASEVVILLACATSYNGFDKSPATEGLDPAELTKKHLASTQNKNYEVLYNAHLADYQKLFNRSKIQIGTLNEQSKLPTDQRIAQFSNGKDQSLTGLFYQFGRYLMIAGSRPGGQPLNLQGMWNDRIIPPWNGGYTVNINAEMNYWPAELTNLSECHEPFLKAIKELSVNGSKTARSMYGNQGWVVHHNTDIWRHTEPIDLCNCSFWPMAQGWLTSHYWERYLFHGDKKFLKNDVYPLLRGVVLFYKDWLVPNKDGYLVTPVGHSPEHQFKYEDGKSTMSPGPTMDMALIRESFARFIEAYDLLGVQDQKLYDEIKAKQEKLLPYQIGKYGQLQEWQFDFEDGEPEHRHISHLYALHPSNQINRFTNPTLNTAVAKSMERRGDSGTGWAMGWKINIHARLLNGDKAHTLLTNLITLVRENDPILQGKGGLYPNMFDACPPFQIDGNFGGTAGIAEMLVQSHAGEIHLLPALPKAWPDGKITGLKARGGFEIDLEWAGGKLKSASVKSALGGNCRIRTNEETIVKGAIAKPAAGANTNALFSFINPEKNRTAAEEKLPAGILKDFQTSAGKTYVVTPGK